MNKEITIYDIAKELNLSVATVSRGLKNSDAVKKPTKKRILQKAVELGYRQNSFASNLRKQKSHTIGIILHELNSNFTTSVLSGIEKVTTAAGYDLIIAHSAENYEREVANAMNLFHKRVDGVIASLSSPTKDLNHFNVFFRKNLPVIFFDRVDETSDHTYVIIDNYKCGYELTKHLIEEGCKRIAFLTANLNRNVYFQRHKGYKDALHDAGLLYDENLVLIKDLNEKSGHKGALEILNMDPRPDGLLAPNDFIAAVCMKEFKLHGINVPEHIAIAGFNNDPISTLVDPQLTTVNYPGKEVGEVAARYLVNQLQSPGDLVTTQRIYIKSALIIRASSLRKEFFSSCNML